MVYRSIKVEALGGMIFIGERSLRHAIHHYLTHYHSERNHQGLDNQLISPQPEVGVPTSKVKRRERLGGLLVTIAERRRDATQDTFTPSDLNATESTERFSHMRAPMIETDYKHIVLNDNNVAMIAGTHTKVIELVLDYQAYGWSPEELQFQHPNFTMGQIHSALAYYWDHQHELDADIERRWQEVKQLQQSRELSPVEKRLKARKTP